MRWSHTCYAPNRLSKTLAVVKLPNGQPARTQRLWRYDSQLTGNLPVLGAEMSRTPTMTASEAESAIGPRGTINVDANNRALVRKWLCANGFPALFAGGLSMRELGLAYNDTSGKALDQLRRKLEETQEDMPDETPDAPAPRAEPRDDTPAPRNGDDNADKLAETLRRLLAGAVDLAKVREIAQEVTKEGLREFAERERGHAPAIEVIVKTPEGEFKDAPRPRHKQFQDLLTNVLLNIPTMLVGPAGSGKTTACEEVARIIEKRFYLQPAASGAHAFTGYMDAQGRFVSVPTKSAWCGGGLLLCDEIDGGDPAGVLVINSMDNGYLHFPDNDEPAQRHPDFRLVATANTHGNGADRMYVRNQLDGATLNRYAVINWDYDESLERSIGSANPDWTAYVQNFRKAVGRTAGVRHIVSTRAIVFGLKMLAQGVPQSTVEQQLLIRDMKADVLERVRASM